MVEDKTCKFCLQLPLLVASAFGLFRHRHIIIVASGVSLFVILM